MAGGLGLTILPAALAPLGRRLHPAVWARIALGLLGGGFLVLEVALGLRGLPVLLDAAGAPGWAGACRHAWAALAHGGPAEGWAALVAAGGIGATALRAAWRWRRRWRDQRAEAWLGTHARSGDVELVELAADAATGFCAPGRPPQVVVTSGLVGLLDEDELGAVLAHEAAHLRRRHWRAFLVGAVVEDTLGALALVRAAVEVLGCALERCADEDAAGADPAQRRVLRQALEKVALAGAPGGPIGLAGPATVAERIAALERPAPTPSPLVLAAAGGPGLALAAATATAGVAWLYGLRAALGAVGLCPL